MTNTEFDIVQLQRPHVRTLKPYSSARDEFTGEADVFLDANENPWGSALEEDFNRYPDPLQRALKAKISEWRGVATDRIFVGNGSDEAIDLLYRAFAEPGEDHALFMPPTYGMYRVSADINQVDFQEIPLTPDFQVQLEPLLEAITPKSKLIFFCSPNNPSGNILSESAIKAVLEKSQGLVIVDEAYIDFALEKSSLPLLEQYPNLVVLQTFSKAWGMANLRIGMAFAHPHVIKVLNKIKPPYNVNGLTQRLAFEALNNQARQQKMVADTLEERSKLAEALAALPQVQAVHPSDANFLLMKIDQAEAWYHLLLKHKIIVRNRTRVLHCEDCLRVTVGTVEENQQLLAALRTLKP